MASNRKNFAAEEKVERVLDANEIVYEKYEEYIDTEKLFEQVYTFEVLLEGADEQEGKN